MGYDQQAVPSTGNWNEIYASLNQNNERVTIINRGGINLLAN